MRRWWLGWRQNSVEATDTLSEAVVDDGQGFTGMGSVPVADLTCRWALQEHTQPGVSHRFLSI